MCSIGHESQSMINKKIIEKPASDKLQIFVLQIYSIGGIVQVVWTHEQRTISLASKINYK